MQNLRINLRPVQVRYGHHDIVPGLTILIFFAAHVLELRIVSWLPNPLLSSTQGTRHSVLDTLGAVLVIPLDVVHEILSTFGLPFAR